MHWAEFMWLARFLLGSGRCFSAGQVAADDDRALTFHATIGRGVGFALSSELS